MSQLVPLMFGTAPGLPGLCFARKGMEVRVWRVGGIRAGKGCLLCLQFTGRALP